MSQPPDIVIHASRSEIRPCPFQPRKHFDEDKLNELGLSLRQVGVIQPLTVRVRPPAVDYPHASYEIICGECRWRGSDERPHPERAETMAAMTTLPVLVRELTDAQALEIMLSENMQRRDLSELEECDAFHRAIEQRDALGELVYASNAAFAEKIGVSADYVESRLKLSKLPKLGRKALEEGRLSFAAARVVVSKPSRIIEAALDVVLNPGKYQIWLGNDYAKEPLSAEAAEEEIAERFVRRFKGVAFDLDDANLLPQREENGERVEGGPCTTCPWNTANDEVAKAKSTGGRRRGAQEKACLNPACFARKVEIHSAAELVRAQEAGHKILGEKEAGKIIQADGELRKNSGYVKLSEKPSDEERNTKVGGKVPTWEKIVTGAATVNVVVDRDKETGEAIRGERTETIAPPIEIVQDANGNVHRVLRREIAVEIAQKVGTAHFLSLSTGGRSLMENDYKDQQAKERAAAKLKSAVSLAAMGELIEQVKVRNVPADFWKWLMEIAAWHGGSDSGNFVVKRRALPGVGHYSEQVEAHAKKMKTAEDQRALAVELLVARLVKFNGIGDKHFKRLCALYGVDAGAIEKRHRADAAEKERAARLRKKEAQKREDAKAKAKATLPAGDGKSQMADGKKAKRSKLAARAHQYLLGRIAAVIHERQFPLAAFVSICAKRGVELMDFDLSKGFEADFWLHLEAPILYGIYTDLRLFGAAKAPKKRTKKKDEDARTPGSLLNMLAQVEAMHVEGEDITVTAVQQALGVDVAAAETLVNEWAKMHPAGEEDVACSDPVDADQAPGEDVLFDESEFAGNVRRLREQVEVGSKITVATIQGKLKLGYQCSLALFDEMVEAGMIEQGKLVAPAE